MPTGPSCGSLAPADAGGEMPSPLGGGCCAASGDPLSLVWALAVALLYRRRRVTSPAP